MDNRSEDFFEFDEEYIRKRIAKFNAEKDIYDLDLIENMAEFCLNEQDYDKAIEILSAAVHLYPYHASTLANYGYALLQKEKEKGFDANWKIPFEYIYKAYQLQPDDAEILHKLGYAYILKGDYQRGIELLHKSMNYAPDYLENYLLLALIHKEGLRYTEAITYLEKFIQLTDEIDTEYADMLIECYSRTKQLSKGLDKYKKIVQEQPYSLKGWYTLAVLYESAGFYLDALQAYHFAITLQESHVNAHISIANIYIRFEAYNKAIEHLKIAFDLDKSHYEVGYSLAECYLYMGFYQKAREYYLETVKIHPQYHEAWFGLGVCAEHYQNFDMAMFYFEKAYTISPYDPDYMLALANTKYRAGYFKDAYQTYRDALKKFPDAIDIWLDFSACLYEQKEFEEAVSVLKKGIEENVYEASLYYRLAAYLYSIIRPQEGDKYFLWGLELDFSKHIEVFNIFPQLRSYQPLLQLIQDFNRKRR
ncbi:MAG: tetratricopeptide repeat protein [Bacteroidia bacterium]|nr:tetratricopeptide repeat protein [Bacteroidia bacterium]MDW8348470.1 tetratricopeptide repeat protein [Bacteroidia bacterium]